MQAQTEVGETAALAFAGSLPIDWINPVSWYTLHSIVLSGGPSPMVDP
ncbi:hypothetical protein [Streptomyces prunicolor]